MKTKEQIVETIKEFYGDTSRSREETREALEEVRDELEILIESLEDE
ncbi:hypothetical protein [Metapseudomonas otitidis]|nr:hypothetical protein [Pseudomonas otitidis]MDG9784667.1 hypothetical protein [Pseudomonas otitidis]